MRLLVTAGNTLTPIDQVRAITNIFTGRTGAAIALEGFQRGHAVTLLTSHPERVAELPGAQRQLDPERWQLFSYRTFNDLASLMEERISRGSFDAIVHCAAVSDYRCEGVFAPDKETHFDLGSHSWQSKSKEEPRLLDRNAGKVKSDEPELWLRLVKTPKLIDKIRGDWSFAGRLVKFKLEVGKTDDELLTIAERSRQQSQADLMVANTLEGAAHVAFIGPVAGRYEKVSRRNLAGRLLDLLDDGRIV